MSSKTDTGRRKFMVTLGLGGAAAAAAVVAGKGSDGKKADGGAQDEGKGYRLTQHIREYYRTARV